MDEKKQNSIIKFISKNEEKLKESLNICTMIEQGYSPCVIELAIKLGADIHEYNDSVLITLAKYSINTMEILEILKNAGMQFNTSKAADATYTAMVYDNLVLAEYLIDNGVNVHWSDDIIIKTARWKASQHAAYYNILRKIDILQ